MELKELNTFLHKHTGAKYFKADLKLFKEKFPESKLIKDFEAAPEFKKAEYDERICAEMLMHQNACIDCIWENRGYYRDKNNFVKPLSEKDSELALSELEKALLNFDLSVKNPHYNTMKQFVFDFKLKVADAKAATYVKALKQLQEKVKEKADFIAEKERLEKEEAERLRLEALGKTDDTTGSDTDDTTDTGEDTSTGNNEPATDVPATDVPVTNEPAANEPAEKKSEDPVTSTQE